MRQSVGDVVRRRGNLHDDQRGALVLCGGRVRGRRSRRSGVRQSVGDVARRRGNLREDQRGALKKIRRGKERIM